MVGSEESGSAVVKVGFPTQNDLLFEIIFKADLGNAFEVGQYLMDDLGLEMWCEPSSAVHPLCTCPSFEVHYNSPYFGADRALVRLVL